MEYTKLVTLIQSGKNLGSCSEMCAVACATEDISKAPEPYNSDIHAAWNRLNQDQRKTVNEYRSRFGIPVLNEDSPSLY